MKLKTRDGFDDTTRRRIEVRLAYLGMHFEAPHPEVQQT